MSIPAPSFPAFVVLALADEVLACPEVLELLAELAGPVELLIVPGDAAADSLDPSLRACLTDAPAAELVERAMCILSARPTLGAFWALPRAYPQDAAALHELAGRAWSGTLEPELAQRRAAWLRTQRDAEARATLLERLLEPGSNVVDVGCAYGSGLADALRLAPEGRHVAFEPLPDVHAWLAEHFPGCDVRCAAASNADGEADFVRVSGNLGMSGFLPRPQASGPRETLRVRTERLDSALPADYAPTLITIDVEGAERQVLEGAIETIARHRPVVVVEHGRAAAQHGTAPEQVFDLLCDRAGLAIWDLDGVGPYTRERFADAVNGGTHWNWVAAPDRPPLGSELHAVDEEEAPPPALVAVAFADEIVSRPELLEAFARDVTREDGVELVVYGRGLQPEELSARLGPALTAAGLDSEDAPDVVVLAVPADPETEERLAARAHCVYARIVPEGPFRSLRRISHARTSDLRELAARSRAGILPIRPGREELDLLRRSNFLLLTYDSCRYDVLRDAATPVLDSYAEIVPAQTPGSFTFAAHQAFFVGMLPNATEERPYYNRFTRQLLGLGDVGETDLAKDTLCRVPSSTNLVAGLREHGYQTVGAGAMNWFRQDSLTGCFERFAFTGTDADVQIDYLLSEIDPDRPFFGFVNFGETHDPYEFKGKTGRLREWVQSRRMVWPPTVEGPVGSENEAYGHQREAAEFLDSRLPRLFSALPAETIVILCGDHGECFGEDGYWGHGVNHPKVLEVPLAIFRLDGAELR